MLAMSLILAGAAAEPALAAQCRVLVAAKHSGEAVYADDAAAAPCSGRRIRPALRYDVRRKAAIARADLDTGTELGRVYLPRRPAVGAGEQVRITAAVGHVLISRDAVALQPANAGQRFFARLADGTIFVAPAAAPGAKQGERQ